MLQEVPCHGPPSRPTLFRIAFAYDKQGRFGESQPYLDKALELVKSGKDNSKLPAGDIYAEKGYKLLQSGKYRDALPLYDLLGDRERI